MFVDLEVAVGGRAPAVEALDLALAQLFLVADHVQVHPQFIAGQHPHLGLHQAVLLLHGEAQDEVEVGAFVYTASDPLHRVRGVVDPHLTLEGELLRALRFELQFVAPIDTDPGAIRKEVVIVAFAAIGYGTDEVLAEDHQEVVVDVHVLVHVAHELAHALVLDAAHLRTADHLTACLGFLAVVHLAQALRHEDRQRGFGIGAVDILEHEGEGLEEFLLLELLGDVVEVELDLVVRFVLVGAQFLAVVHRLVGNGAAQDDEGRVLVPARHLEFHQFLPGPLQLDVDDLRLVPLHGHHGTLVTDVLEAEAVRSVVGVEAVPAIEVRNARNAAVDECHVDEGQHFACNGIAHHTRDFRCLCNRHVRAAQHRSKHQEPVQLVEICATCHACFRLRPRCRSPHAACRPLRACAPCASVCAR